MTDDGRRALFEAIEEDTKAMTVSKEEARRVLIEEGIYGEDGELTEEFGGTKRETEDA